MSELNLTSWVEEKLQVLIAAQNIPDVPYTIISKPDSLEIYINSLLLTRSLIKEIVDSFFKFFPNFDIYTKLIPSNRLLASSIIISAPHSVINEFIESPPLPQEQQLFFDVLDPDDRFLAVLDYLDKNDISYSEPTHHVLLIDDELDKEFYYYYKKKKWRQKGKNTYYYCKGIEDLCTRFIFSQKT